MIETTELIRFLQNSQLPEALKQRFIPLIQTASEETRQDLYLKVKDFNEKAIRIRKFTEPLTVDDIIFLRGQIEDYQDRKQEEKQILGNTDSLLTANV